MRTSRLAPTGLHLERWMLALVLVAALALRCYRLDQPLMWCDEAESALNALTILQHGVPIDRYLDLPIFENILTEPWPEHPEYEFRDTSYSASGLAVYHGWLPLYLMAGSLRGFGIEPSHEASNLRAKYTPLEMSRRTIAARLPSVFFGVIFLILVFIAGNEMYGRDAGWAGLLAATVAVPIVHVARQARYYSLTLALCTACCLLIWRMAQRGWWRDFVLGAICAVLLFHTHILTFLIVCLAGLITLPRILGKGRGKLALASLIGVIGIVPWMLASGFLRTVVNVPKAITNLDLPWDLFIYPIERWPVTLFLLLCAVWLLIVTVLRQRLPQWVGAPFLEARRPFIYLAAWGLIGWLAFMLLIPSASLWFPRAYLGIVGPGIVLGGIMFAAMARVIGPRWSVPIGCVLFLGFIYANVRANYSWLRDTQKSEKLAGMIDQMRVWQLQPGTKIYSTPSDQLILTYYTDVPVQSIAPVRRRFLDNYSGDVVVMECFTRLWPIWSDQVLDTAKRHGQILTGAQAESWARRLTARGMGEVLNGRVARVLVPAEPLPPFGTELLERQRELTYNGSNLADNPVVANPAIFRGYDMPDYSWWWQIFFYRYVDVESRSGENLNYANRIRNATATVLPGTWVIYHSPSGGSARLEER